ncbi:hypothetical protein NUW54_g8339 [Trametes sanguinea]|uniref:Uncharacterized protein n=1 Tax=Trametes sanguinea TaxID=158606 RepID=A0ACC1PGW8_9APHY|nr:hypothetical protein NUW54_g8339 [Trametes sanguinea]
MLSCWPHEQFNHSSSSRSLVDATQECLFAQSPSAFEYSAHYVPLSLAVFYLCFSSAEGPVPGYKLMSYGIRTRLPRLIYRRRAGLAGEEVVEVIVLACKDPARGVVALLLRPTDGRTATSGHPDNQTSSRQFKVGARCDSAYIRGALLKDMLHTTTSQTPSSGFQRRTQMTSLYIPYRPYELATEPYPTLRRKLSDVEDDELKQSSPIFFTCPCEVTIEGWTLSRLRKAGYIVSNPERNSLVILVRGKPTLVTLCRGKETVTIELRSCTGQYVPNTRSLPPFTATVAFKNPRVRSPRLKAARSEDSNLALLAGCWNDHVQDWPNLTASFSRDGVTVELIFTGSSWADQICVNGGDACSLYTP